MKLSQLERPWNKTKEITENRFLIKTSDNFDAIKPASNGQMMKKAAIVLANAFGRDPLFNYFLPGEAYRSAVLPILMRALIEMIMPDGHAYYLSQPVNAVALFQPPNRCTIPASRIGLAVLKYGFRFKLNSIRRMLRVITELEKLQPDRKHYHVMIIGVEPSMQRKGMGTLLLHFLAELADQQSVPIHLETMNPSNVDFYIASGYNLVGKFRCDKGQGPETYIMQRIAQ